MIAAGRAHCREPCSRRKEQLTTSSFGLHARNISHVKSGAGFTSVLFASFFIAEKGKIIYNITRQSKRKEDKPR